MIVYEKANCYLATERRRQPGKLDTPLRVLVRQAHPLVSSVDVPCGWLGSDKTTRAMGMKRASVPPVGYGDYECPYRCAAYPTVKGLQKRI